MASVQRGLARASAGGIVVAHYLPVFHHEANPLELGNVCDGVAPYGNQIGEFPCLDRADTIAPAQHFSRIHSNRPDHLQCRHSSFMQVDENGNARLPARLPGGKPHMSDPMATFTPDFTTRCTN